MAAACRCPNPDACHHDAELLAQQHPNRSPHKTWRLRMLKWEEYGQQLCSPGYMGMLCGTCQGGYGQTAPFKCVACLSQPGQQAPQKCGASPSYAPEFIGKPDRKALSGLWAAYWLVLTLSTMFGVWLARQSRTTALTDKGGSNSATGTASSRQGCNKSGGCKDADASQCSSTCLGSSTASISPKKQSAATDGGVLEQTMAVWKVGTAWEKQMAASCPTLHCVTLRDSCC